MVTISLDNTDITVLRSPIEFCETPISLLSRLPPFLVPLSQRADDLPGLGKCLWFIVDWLDNLRRGRQCMFLGKQQELSPMTCVSDIMCGLTKLVSLRRSSPCSLFQNFVRGKSLLQAFFLHDTWAFVMRYKTDLILGQGTVRDHGPRSDDDGVRFVRCRVLQQPRESQVFCKKRWCMCIVLGEREPKERTTGSEFTMSWKAAFGERL